MAAVEKPPISLADYAAASVRLRDASDAQVPAILRDHGLDKNLWERARDYWTRALDRDADEGDGELLLAWSAACDAVRTAPPESAAPSPAEPAPIATPGPLAPSVEKPSFLIARSPPVGGAASPWASSVAPAVANPAPPIAAPPIHVPGPIPPPRAVHGIAWEDGATMAADEPEPVSALPFPNATPGPTLPAAPMSSTPMPRASEPGAPQSSAAPPSPGLATHTSSNELTFERYAALAAEIAVFPHRAARAREKYALADEAAFRRVEATWHARFAADAALESTWRALFEKYRAWLVARDAKRRG